MLSIKNPSNTARLWLIDLLGLIITLSVFYAMWLGSYALFTPDEGRYSEVAREMIATKDYITPRVNGVAFLDKPVLYYWLQAAAIHLFGLKEWALRFFPALIGILGCIMTYASGRILFNRRTGILSALILATCPLYFGAAHYANLDLEVAVFVSMALLFFIIAAQSSSDKKRSIGLWLAYLFAGLAALTKGLIGIVFPMMIIGAWVVTLNRWTILKKMHLVRGLILFSLIVAPWYYLVQLANPEFLHFFFVKQQVSRFLTTDKFNNPTVVWFYIPIVLAGIVPWCIFIIQALAQQIKNCWKTPNKYPVETFLLLWFFLVFLFFSIPKSKTIGYILPVFPPLALLLGNYLNHTWEETKNKGIHFAKIGYLFLCGFIIAFCLIIQRLGLSDLTTDVYPYLTAAAIVFFISGSIVTFLFKKIQLSQFFSTLILTAITFLLIISASAVAINQKTIKPLALQIKSQLLPTDEVVTYYKYYQDAPVYLERRISIVEDWSAADIPLHDNWVREMWYSMPFQDTTDWLINEATFWKRWISSKRLFVFTDKKLLADLQMKTKWFKKDLYKIAEYNDVVLVSNQKVLS